MARVSAQELAELVPCAVADVERIDALGLLARDDATSIPPRTPTSCG